MECDKIKNNGYICLVISLQMLQGIKECLQNVSEGTAWKAESVIRIKPDIQEIGYNAN